MAHPAKLNPPMFSGELQSTTKGTTLHAEGENHVRKSKFKARKLTPTQKNIE